VTGDRVLVGTAVAPGTTGRMALLPPFFSQPAQFIE
jgi:hypothetical protein